MATSHLSLLVLFIASPYFLGSGSLLVLTTSWTPIMLTLSLDLSTSSRLARIRCPSRNHPDDRPFVKRLTWLSSSSYLPSVPCKSYTNHPLKFRSTINVHDVYTTRVRDYNRPSFTVFKSASLLFQFTEWNVVTPQIRCVLNMMRIELREVGWSLQYQVPWPGSSHFLLWWSLRVHHQKLRWYIRFAVDCIVEQAKVIEQLSSWAAVQNPVAVQAQPSIANR